MPKKSNPSRNPKCDGDRCTWVTGEVRKVPVSADPHHGNTILCFACYQREMDMRRVHNREHPEATLAIPKWESLPVYKEAR